MYLEGTFLQTILRFIMSKVMIRGEAEKMLKAASDELGFRSNTEAVRYAIGLLKMAADAKHKKLEIAMVNADDEIEYKIAGII